MKTGHPQIDREHKELLDHINSFMDACRVGTASSEILNMLRFLKTYTQKHFAHEEDIQVKNQYPYYKEHKKLHEDFIKAILAIEEKVLQGGSSIELVVEVNQKVGFWLIEHIKVEDIKLGKYLASRDALS